MTRIRTQWFALLRASIYPPDTMETSPGGASRWGALTCPFDAMYQDIRAFAQHDAPPDEQCIEGAAFCQWP